jgi:acyl transferase domain-containing protein/acyl-CoA synthetase (AMP-forming)/AMP-acid ligase II/acyl carrier protein
MNRDNVTTANTRTLVDLLDLRADTSGDRTAFHFLQSGETVSAFLDGSGLRAQARKIAACLHGITSPGDRAILLFPPGLEFIAAFFGTLYAGLIAVPCYPPKRNRIDSRFRGIIRDAEPAIALAPSRIIEEIKQQIAPELGKRELNWLAVDLNAARHPETCSASADHCVAPEIRPQQVAFLQYTSGSTSTPKGVMVTHENLLSNLQDLDLGARHNSESVLVTWLPIFHDLGLVYGVLMPIFKGFSCYMMPPSVFLQSPWLWLDAISRFRGTHSAAPNFAYDLCVDSIPPEKRSGLDLGTWRSSLNGGEPVREETLRRFYESFRESGLDDTVVCPGYGLAESTLKVAIHRRGLRRVTLYVDKEALARNRVIPVSEISESTNTLVSCGWSETNTRIAIVDPETLQRCPAGGVGEIWVSGQSVAQGYWNRPEATEESFQAFIDRDGPFLRTGDLGFVHEDGLYITGRIKDTIIVHGLNYYAHDIEATAAMAHLALRRNGGAAFCLENDGESRLILIQEVKRTFVRKVDMNAIVASVRSAIAREHQLQLHRFVLVKPGGVPKTSSGKIRRRAAKEAFEAGKIEDVIASWETPAISTATPLSDLQDLNQAQGRRAFEDWLIDFCAERLGILRWELNPGAPLSQYGMDSLAAVDIAQAIGRRLGLYVEPGIVYNHPTIAALATHFIDGGISKAVFATPSTRSKQSDREDCIAIVGIGCRFPGGANPAAYFELLRNGSSAVGPMPLNRPGAEAFYAMAKRPGLAQIARGGFLREIDKFDAAFFGIAPREAEYLDPQQRLLLEVSWEALENAGLSTDDLIESDTGVFVGISTNDYSRFFPSHPEEYAGTGNALSVAANRLSYTYNWRGPSMVIDTACSSSLVAIHQACRSLETDECRLALAGGVNLILSPHWSVSFARAGMLSPDGECKTFDRGANGYVRGEGCGLVVLQRFSNAARDGRRILALIRGSAINQDGCSNGLTAPNGVAQRAVISQALTKAQVAPSAVSYVEAHGTGTELGDAIELTALQDVFYRERQGKYPLWVGSVKPNIGHLEAAAGVAGLIKVVLALVHREIPPHRPFSALDPRTSTGTGLPLVPTKVEKWESDSRRIAGVSSFGFGGTNAHIIVEEANVEEPVHGNGVEEDPPKNRSVVFAISAKSEDAMRALACDYRGLINSLSSDGELIALANAVCTRRSQLTHRAAVVADRIEMLDQSLARLTGTINAPGDQLFQVSGYSICEPKVAFLFTGQGSHHAGMARELYENEPVFRGALQRCATLLENTLSVPLIDLLYKDEHAKELGLTGYAQPALFAIQYALCELLQYWGIVPDGVLGHSAGEYAAAYAAKASDLETGLRLIVERGRLMQALPADGKMAAVFATVDQVTKVISEFDFEIDIAGMNSPAETVISGKAGAVDTACYHFNRLGRIAQVLPVSHAFHSRSIEPVLQPFAKFLSQHQLKRPVIPFISSVTARTESEAVVRPEYWTQQLRQPVRFAEAAAELRRLGYNVLLEIGPGAVLTNLAQRTLAAHETSRSGNQELPLFIHTLQRGRSDRRQIAEAVAQLFVSGKKVSWRNFYHETSVASRRLPNYPFQRRRYWLSQEDPEIALPSVKANIYQIAWRPILRSRSTASPLEKRFIVLCKEQQIGYSLAAELSNCGAETDFIVSEGQLAQILKRDQERLCNIVYLTHSTGQNAMEAISYHFTQLLQLGHICTEARRSVALWIVTRGAVPVFQPEGCNPVDAALWGFARTAAVEHPELRIRLIDCAPGALGSEIALLARSLTGGSTESEYAIRSQQILIPRLSTSTYPEGKALTLRSDATYLVTGGAGAIGCDLLQRLLQRGARHLMVVNRSAIQPEQKFQAIVHETERLRGSLTFKSADVADRNQVHALMKQIRESYPPLRGVFHLAGVTADGLLRGYDPERLRAVLAAKADGAQILHEETSSIALDHFVCFSSASALFGSIGLGAYAVANAFVDGLAAARHSAGLPGLSIQWGPWESRGMNARLSSVPRKNWQQEGWVALPADQALDCLEHLLVNKATGTFAVASVNWQTFADRRSRLASFLEELNGATDLRACLSQAEADRGNGSLSAKLTNLPKSDRIKQLRPILVHEVRQIVGLPPGQDIDPKQGFTNLGMDSMMAVALRNRLQTMLEHELPATLAYTYPNIEQLGDYLLEILGATAVTESQTPAVDKAQKLDIEPAPDQDVAKIIALKYELCFADNRDHR